MQEKHGDVLTELGEVKERENSLVQSLWLSTCLKLSSLRLSWMKHGLQTTEVLHCPHESSGGPLRRWMPMRQTAVLERLHNEHAAEVRMAEIGREGSLSKSEASRDPALKELQEAHAAASARKETSFAEELKKLNAEHARALTTRDEDYALEMNKLRSSHEGLLAKLKEEWRVETERLNNALVTQKEESGIDAAKARTEVDKVMQNQQEAQAVLLRDIEQGHNADEHCRLSILSWRRKRRSLYNLRKCYFSNRSTRRLLK